MSKIAFRGINNIYKYSKMDKEEFINLMNKELNVFPIGFSNYSQSIKEGLIGLNRNINKIDEKYASYIVEKLINKRTLCSDIFFYLISLIENWYEYDGKVCNSLLVPFVEKYEDKDHLVYYDNLMFYMKYPQNEEFSKYANLPDVKEDIEYGIEWFLINKDYTDFDKKYWTWCEVSKDIFKDNYKGIIDDIFKIEWECEWYNAPIRF